MGARRGKLRRAAAKRDARRVAGVKCRDWGGGGGCRGKREWGVLFMVLMDK